ncbi:MAG: hydroxymethylglutaryl-CoA reductase, degradative [Polyangiaceae bacterium]|nr:hydroxymethylglutaryl-CoA reductase, degradative [Polyangiaceae bacterium]
MSRASGFSRLSRAARLRKLRELVALSAASEAYLSGDGGLSFEEAERMSENVVSTFGLPLGLGLNFVVNDREYVVPMAVEEPSVVAAACNAARMVRACGGFRAEADPSVMTAQVELEGVPEPDLAPPRLAARRADVLRACDAAVPRLVARGFGARDLEARVLDREEGVVVCDLFIDVGDAMGANLVDTIAEAVAPLIGEIVGGRVGLRILSNLPLRRRVRVTCELSDDVLGGPEVAVAISRASRFAELDPLRAVTHNKGFLNGVDAAAIATGQDFRGIEAGAHAFAAHGGVYRPLSTFSRTARGLLGRAELPLAVGTVGGSTAAHRGVRAAFEILQVESARELAGVLASVGLASNLAALRALATEGIQKGHMRLHHRKDAPPAAQSREVTLGGEP